MLRRALAPTAVLLFSCFALSSCGGEDPDAPPVVDIVAEDYEFTVSDTVRSGWTTLRMHNQGSEHHVFVLIGLPEGIIWEDYQREVVPAYDTFSTLIREDEMSREEAGKRVAPLLPEWYSERILAGGVSLTAPSRSSQTTLYLGAGTYVLECYAKTAEQEFHAMEGMLRPLQVTGDTTGAVPPESDYELRITGLDLTGVQSLPPGQHTIAVHFGETLEDNPYRHLHLARLDEETSAEDLAEWWKVDPVMPAPVEFLGGPQQMRPGQTAYVRADFEAGQYAWVLGEPPERGEVETFTVE